MTFQEFLRRLRTRNTAGRGRIITASRYLDTVSPVMAGLGKSGVSPAEWAKFVKRARSLPAYRNDDTRIVKRHNPTKSAGSLTPILEIDAVVTSVKKDRDGDVLEVAGANLDPLAPFLWQHDPTAPIGKLVKELSRENDRLTCKFAVADTALGNDAAYLAEFGALRISHGFRPIKFEPITEKNGDATGFRVSEYEIMEVSLVSVPSNTDAVLTSLSRGKLTSPKVKGWAERVSAGRPVMVKGGWTKEDDEAVGDASADGAADDGAEDEANESPQEAFEGKLVAAAASVKHSSDYGLCFYLCDDPTNPADVTVWWTAADADADGTTADGEAYTTAEDIKALFAAVEGVTDVQVSVEANPPLGEGWVEVYPERKEWKDSEADGEQSDDSVTPDAPPPAAHIHPGHAKRCIGKFGKAAPAGSAEAAAQALYPQLVGFLSGAGVPVNEGAYAFIEGTYADKVVVTLYNPPDENGEGGSTASYAIAYTSEGGVYTLTGEPTPVTLQTVVADADGNNPTAPPAPEPETPTPEAHVKPVAKGKGPVRLKGKITRKQADDLTDASDHIDAAMSDPDMKRATKTLLRQAKTCIDRVKSEGVDDTTQQAPAETEEAKAVAVAVKQLATAKTADDYLAPVAILKGVAARAEAMWLSALTK